MIVIGIDPGLGGAIVEWDGESFSVNDMPTNSIDRGGKNKREIDIAFLSSMFAVNGAEAIGRHAFVEQVASMPGQGVSSVFAFGKGYGIILGVLAAKGIPVTLVPPQRWKKALQVPAGKDAARARASQVLPFMAREWPLKKHDGRAEAALIAEYGRRQLNL